jgi:hypothetical protein
VAIEALLLVAETAARQRDERPFADAREKPLCALEDPQLAKSHAHSLLLVPDDLAENRCVIGYQQCEEPWDMVRARQG